MGDPAPALADSSVRRGRAGECGCVAAARRADPTGRPLLRPPAAAPSTCTCASASSCIVDKQASSEQESSVSSPLPAILRRARSYSWLRCLVCSLTSLSDRSLPSSSWRMCGDRVQPAALAAARLVLVRLSSSRGGANPPALDLPAAAPRPPPEPRLLMIVTRWRSEREERAKNKKREWRQNGLAAREQARDSNKSRD